jgi:hypothetical protein
MQHEEFEAAEVYASAAVRANPTRADYYLLLAHIRWRAGDPLNALRTIEQRLSLGGDERSLHVLRADVEASSGVQPRPRRLSVGRSSLPRVTSRPTPGYGWPVSALLPETRRRRSRRSIGFGKQRILRRRRSTRWSGPCP